MRENKRNTGNRSPFAMRPAVTYTMPEHEMRIHQDPHKTIGDRLNPSFQRLFREPFNQFVAAHQQPYLPPSRFIANTGIPVWHERLKPKILSKPVLGWNLDKNRLEYYSPAQRKWFYFSPYTDFDGEGAFFVPADSSVAAIGVTLKTEYLTSRPQIIVKDVGGNASVNNVTVSCEGNTLIDGSPTAIINTNYGSLQLHSYNLNWYIV